MTTRERPLRSNHANVADTALAPVRYVRIPAGDAVKIAPTVCGLNWTFSAIGNGSPVVRKPDTSNGCASSVFERVKSRWPLAYMTFESLEPMRTRSAVPSAPTYTAVGVPSTERKCRPSGKNDGHRCQH